MKKTRAQKSHATVPLSKLPPRNFNSLIHKTLEKLIICWAVEQFFAYKEACQQILCNSI